MKSLYSSRLMFVIALALGLCAAWTVATPVVMLGESLIGGADDVKGACCNDTHYEPNGCDDIEGPRGQTLDCVGGIVDCVENFHPTKRCDCQSQVASCAGTMPDCAWCDAKCETPD